MTQQAPALTLTQWRVLLYVLDASRPVERQAMKDTLHLGSRTVDALLALGLLAQHRTQRSKHGTARGRRMLTLTPAGAVAAESYRARRDLLDLMPRARRQRDASPPPPTPRNTEP